jgi:hypothetical protein
MYATVGVKFFKCDEFTAFIFLPHYKYSWPLVKNASGGRDCSVKRSDAPAAA